MKTGLRYGMPWQFAYMIPFVAIGFGSAMLLGGFFSGDMTGFGPVFVAACIVALVLTLLARCANCGKSPFQRHESDLNGFWDIFTPRNRATPERVCTRCGSNLQL